MKRQEIGVGLVLLGTVFTAATCEGSFAVALIGIVIAAVGYFLQKENPPQRGGSHTAGEFALEKGANK